MASRIIGLCRGGSDIIGQIVTDHYNRTGIYTDLKSEFIRYYGIKSRG